MAYNTEHLLRVGDAKIIYDSINGRTELNEEYCEQLNGEVFTLTVAYSDASPTGWKLLDNGLCTGDADYKLVKYPVEAGKMYHIVSDHKAQFQTVASVPSSGTSNRVGLTYGVGTFDAVAPSTATYLIISTTVEDSSAEVDNFIPNVSTLIKNVENVSVLPVLRNGSYSNAYNENSVTNQYIARLNHNYPYMRLDFIGDVSDADTFAFSGCFFKGQTDGTTTAAAWSSSTGSNYSEFNSGVTELLSEPHQYINIDAVAGFDHVAVTAWKKENGSFVPIRVADDNYSIRISFCENPYTGEAAETTHDNANARHVPGNAGTPLTLLYFADIHKDTKALSRISQAAKRMGAGVDGMICVGDMVNNDGGEIASWWNPEIMTAVGNHDSATYSGGTYNWTGVSMADRDTYYIAPFEIGWGITHTAGTSYYYKDYAAQKVRLIVMDGMLYNEESEAATAQTTWLEGLLASAITANLHVLIAIHSPHGGAAAVDCSFSRFGATTMPTNEDCNTPQTVIDAVASAIANGLKFAGYITGHTHQDGVWDAEDNGEQLMFAVTCANTSNVAQWRNSDQDRNGFDCDAFNLITIDTTNSLVKVVRGGGADIDDHMRTRKAVCFDYSTGDKVGEVL